MVKSNRLNSKLISEERVRKGIHIMPTPRFDEEGGVSSSDVQSMEVDLGQVLKVVAVTAPEGVKKDFSKRIGFPAEQMEMPVQRERE